LLQVVLHHLHLPWTTSTHPTLTARRPKTRGRRKRQSRRPAT